MADYFGSELYAGESVDDVNLKRTDARFGDCFGLDAHQLTPHQHIPCILSRRNPPHKTHFPRIPSTSPNLHSTSSSTPSSYRHSSHHTACAHPHHKAIVSPHSANNPK
eukprot:GHVN01054353.1.p1 GENE.GHVN01054353.1~~GHVN01054353.1.p1  ORF type:complete len:108 (+),score=14.92 GHVN01054353.1:63-386(+)